jgi:hypothetical protein
VHREIPFPDRMLATRRSLQQRWSKTKVASRKEPAVLSQIEHFYEIGDY